MAIPGWTVDVAGTRGVITKALPFIEDLPACGDDMVTAFSNAATACDHVAIGAMLDTVLTTFVSPLYDVSYNAGNHVLAKLEEAVAAYVSSDDQMGENAVAAIDDIPRGEDG